MVDLEKIKKELKKLQKEKDEKEAELEAVERGSKKNELDSLKTGIKKGVQYLQQQIEPRKQLVILLEQIQTNNEAQLLAEKIEKNNRDIESSKERIQKYEQDITETIAVIKNNKKSIKENQKNNQKCSMAIVLLENDSRFLKKENFEEIKQKINALDSQINPPEYSHGYDGIGVGFSGSLGGINKEIMLSEKEKNRIIRLFGVILSH